MLDKTKQLLLKDFIETYKCLPCLWDSQDKLYLHKEAREQAYEILLEKYRALADLDGSIASIDALKKKIDYLRGSYRREMKKVFIKRLKGKYYEPKLWYYNLMKFLDDNHFDTSVKTPVSDNEKRTYTSGEEDVDFGETHCQLQSNQSQEIYDEDDFEAPSSKKSKDDSMFFVAETSQPEILEHNHSNEETIREMDEPESFGKTIGLQLKELNQMQRTIAEKLISEVIFYGRLDKLNLGSTFNLNENYD